MILIIRLNSGTKQGEMFMDHPLYKLITEQLDDIYTYNKKDQQTVISRVAGAAVLLVGEAGQQQDEPVKVKIKTYTAKDFSVKRFPVPGEAYIFLYDTCQKLPYEVNVAGSRKYGYFKDKESALIFAEALTNRKTDI